MTKTKTKTKTKTGKISYKNCPSVKAFLEKKNQGRKV